MQGNYLERINQTTAFYLSHLALIDLNNLPKLSNTLLIFTTRHQTAISANPVYVQEGVLNMNYDLSNITAKGLALDWAPFFTLDSCDDNMLMLNITVSKKTRLNM